MTSHIEQIRTSIEEAYADHPTGCGKSIGELLCYEIHENGLTFEWLAQKWNISLPTLGELIWDHCKRLEELPSVEHGFSAPNSRKEIVRDAIDAMLDF